MKSNSGQKMCTGPLTSEVFRLLLDNGIGTASPSPYKIGLSPGLLESNFRKSTEENLAKLEALRSALDEEPGP